MDTDPAVSKEQASAWTGIRWEQADASLDSLSGVTKSPRSPEQ